MASTLGKTSRVMNVAVDSRIQRCSSSSCSKVKILSALSLTGVVKNAVPVSVGFIVFVMQMFSPLLRGSWSWHPVDAQRLRPMCRGHISNPIYRARGRHYILLRGFPQFSSQDFANQRFWQAFTEFELLRHLVCCQFTLTIGEYILAGLFR